MNEIKSFEINKIYHITLYTNEFEDDAFQLDYENFNTNDLIHIHLIDKEQSIESNLIIFFDNIINNNLYYKTGNNKYYFYYDKDVKMFYKVVGV